MTGTKWWHEIRPGDRVLLDDHGTNRPLPVAATRRGIPGGWPFIQFADGTEIQVDPSVPILMAGGGRP